MNGLVMDYVENRLREFPQISGDVLEVGSYDKNGTVRPLFADKKRFPSYVGVDMRPGPAVDVVMKANALDFPDESFDCVVCCETIEHDDRPWESVLEFNRVLRTGGWLILTTSGIGFHYHPYPADYWRFTLDGLAALLSYGGFAQRNIINHDQHHQVMCAAVKFRTVDSKRRMSALISDGRGAMGDTLTVQCVGRRRFVVSREEDNVHVELVLGDGPNRRHLATMVLIPQETKKLYAAVANFLWDLGELPMKEGQTMGEWLDA